MLSLLRCSSQPYYLTLKRLNPRKPHNSAMVGTVMCPEYRNTRKFKTDTSDSSVSEIELPGEHIWDITQGCYHSPMSFICRV